ncbi:MAG: BACON domain-containing protein [Bacteroidales bacterium]|nr:BACON domain-containing protein [Bacteroidales bacterium]
MKKWFLPACLCALLAVCLGTASCEKYALPKLEMSADTLRVPLEGGLFDVTLTSNVRWMFDTGSIPEWIYIDTTYGQSDYEEVDYTLSVKVKENKDGEARKAVMTYSSLTLARTFVVEQAGPEIPAEPETPAEGE